MKNKTVAAGAEALSNKVRNFNDAMETGRQNVQNIMDSIGNQRQPAFALAGMEMLIYQSLTFQRR